MNLNENIEKIRKKILLEDSHATTDMRILLEGILKLKGIDCKTFNDAIKKAKDTNIIDSVLFAKFNLIRAYGNQSAHEKIPFNKRNVNSCFQTFIEILEDMNLIKSTTKENYDEEYEWFNETKCKILKRIKDGEISGPKLKAYFENKEEFFTNFEELFKLEYIKNIMTTEFIPTEDDEYTYIVDGDSLTNLSFEKGHFILSRKIKENNKIIKKIDDTKIWR